MKSPDEKLRELEYRMRTYLKELVKQGCPLCDRNGGYTEFPITGKVCQHMIKKRERYFSGETDNFILQLLSIPRNTI